jgi:acyl-CoA synthetase (AMP-forming)/AMP-acid ligase II
MTAAAPGRVIDVRTGLESTWADLPERTVPAPAAIVVDSSFDALSWARAHAETGAEFLIVAAGRMEQNLRTELLEGGFNIVQGDEVEPTTAPRTAEDGRLWLLTSGSTGRPKRIGHTLESLTTVAGDLAPRRWLCPYSPGTYAWWQVVTLALGSPGQDLVVVDPAHLDGWVAAAAMYRVTAASGTPTFWRQTLMSQKEHLAEVPLAQITLGGEPVDQAILDQLAAAFPEARISWIYASSELGASIVVHDGRAGFPLEWLDRDTPDRPRLSVRDGELVIASPHHGAGLDGAVATGDAVRRDQRRRIQGVGGRRALDAFSSPRRRVGPGAWPQVSPGGQPGRGRHRAEPGTRRFTRAPGGADRVVCGTAARVRRPASDQGPRPDPGHRDRKEPTLEVSRRIA